MDTIKASSFWKMKYPVIKNKRKHGTHRENCFSTGYLTGKWWVFFIKNREVKGSSSAVKTACSRRGSDLIPSTHTEAHHSPNSSSRRSLEISCFRMTSLDSRHAYDANAGDPNTHSCENKI